MRHETFGKSNKIIALWLTALSALTFGKWLVIAQFASACQTWALHTYKTNYKTAFHCNELRVRSECVDMNIERCTISFFCVIPRYIYHTRESICCVEYSIKFLFCSNEYGYKYAKWFSLRINCVSRCWTFDSKLFQFERQREREEVFSKTTAKISRSSSAKMRTPIPNDKDVYQCDVFVSTLTEMYVDAQKKKKYQANPCNGTKSMKVKIGSKTYFSCELMS